MPPCGRPIIQRLALPCGFCIIEQYWRARCSPRDSSMSGPITSALELGCGTASTLDAIARPARCVGVDRDPQAVEQARAKYPRVQVETGDIFNLPYPEKSFDLVYSVGLLNTSPVPSSWHPLAIHQRHATKYVALKTGAC